jgi:predicted nucleic acid-binding protein
MVLRPAARYFTKAEDAAALFQLRMPDALIAATALENRLTLMTRNRKDFDNVRGLRIRAR